MTKKLIISSFSLAAVLLGLGLVCPASAGGSATDAREAQSNRTVDAQPADTVEVDVQPILVFMPKVVYPKEARSKQLEGIVEVRAMVGIEGKVVKAEIGKSAHPLLDQSAIASVEKAVFKPAQLGGKPVAVWVTLPVRFLLHDAKKK